MQYSVVVYGLEMGPQVSFILTSGVVGTHAITVLVSLLHDYSSGSSSIKNKEPPMGTSELSFHISISEVAS